MTTFILQQKQSLAFLASIYFFKCKQPFIYVHKRWKYFIDRIYFAAH